MSWFLEILGGLLKSLGGGNKDTDRNESPGSSRDDLSRTSSRDTFGTFPRTCTVNSQIKSQPNAQNTSQMKSGTCPSRANSQGVASNVGCSLTGVGKDLSTTNLGNAPRKLENFGKPKVLSSSSTPTYDSVQKRILDPHTYKVHKPELNYESTTSSFIQPTPAAKPSMFSSEQSPVPPKLSFIPDSPSSSSSSSFGALPSSSKIPRFSNKPVLSRATLHPKTQQTKPNYISVEKAAAPIYMIPEDIEDLIKKDIVPDVLKKPLSPSTYKDYFRSLLYAEDYYLEKWDGFEMEKVTLELHEAAIYNRKGNDNNLRRYYFEDDKVFVAFEMDSIPERRPFLLSRDFAYLRPSGTNMEPFQGIIYRVVKSNLVLVEFWEEFLSQHHPQRKYDVSFSFNRVCLKRAHQAVESVSAPCFKNFLFPDSDSLSHNFDSVSADHLYISHILDAEQASAVRRILGHQESVPFLVEGPLCVTKDEKPSQTGAVIIEAVLQIYRTVPNARILICAPSNRTCDVIMKRLKKGIPESCMFRANATFRERDGVPLEILPSCHYEEEEECFSVPLLEELQKFKIIVSTYMSCYRLHNEGLGGGDFSRIFMLDTSSTIEPEVMVAVANLADERTNLVVTGAPGNRSGWVRSKIGRQNGLMTSYFERLWRNELYQKLGSRLIAKVKDTKDGFYNRVY